MSRWKALPAELDPRVRQLVVRLRRLKDHGDLSMHRLAAKTGYSQKSWERYLNGRSLPPREAVEALARIGGEDPIRLLVLHELAGEAWEKRRRVSSATEAEEAEEEEEVPSVEEGSPEGETPSTADGKTARPHGRSLRIAVAAGAVALVLAVVSAVLLVVRLSDNGTDTDSRTTANAVASSAGSVPAPGSAPTYTCRVQRTDGQWYAGNSRTRDAIVSEGQAGPDVAEVQCLLRRAGFSPGDVDGVYGPLTEQAVKGLQKRAGLPTDGIVGPHTWGALRK